MSEWRFGIVSRKLTEICSSDIPLSFRISYWLAINISRLSESFNCGEFHSLFPVQSTQMHTSEPLGYFQSFFTDFMMLNVYMGHFVPLLELVFKRQAGMYKFKSTLSQLGSWLQWLSTLLYLITSTCNFYTHKGKHNPCTPSQELYRSQYKLLSCTLPAWQEKQTTKRRVRRKGVVFISNHALLVTQHQVRRNWEVIHCHSYDPGFLRPQGIN